MITCLCMVTDASWCLHFAQKSVTQLYGLPFRDRRLVRVLSYSE